MIGQDGVAIRIENVSKSYRVYKKPGDLLREVFTKRTQHQLYHALKNIDLEIPRGECVGVIGANGAGKSTLLKIVAGTLSPTTGTVATSGRVSAILELGTGFHPEYSGRDNVYLGGMCLGMSRQEMDRKLDWVIEFSELASVIDKPFKTYSSGMQARLTFATAISIDPEILIIDEALAAGDAYFVVKCGRRVRELCESGATVLFVSHSTHQVATLCNRAVWIDDGSVRALGPAVEICRRYDYAVHERISGGTGKTLTIERFADTVGPEDQGPEPSDAVDDSEPHADVAPEISEEPASSVDLDAGRQIARSDAQPIVGLETLHSEIFRRGPVVITRVEWLTGDGRPADRPRTCDTLLLRVHYACDDPAALTGSLGLAIGIHRQVDNLLIAQFSTVNPPRDEDMVHYEDAPFRKPAGSIGILEARFGQLQLLAGDYIVSLGILPNAPGTSDFYEYHHQRYLLTVLRNGYPSGAVFYPAVEWRHESDPAVVSHSYRAAKA